MAKKQQNAITINTCTFDPNKTTYLVSAKTLIKVRDFHITKKSLVCSHDTIVYGFDAEMNEYTATTHPKRKRIPLDDIGIDKTYFLLNIESSDSRSWKNVLCEAFNNGLTDAERKRCDKLVDFIKSNDSSCDIVGFTDAKEPLIFDDSAFHSIDKLQKAYTNPPDDDAYHSLLNSCSRSGGIYSIYQEAYFSIDGDLNTPEEIIENENASALKRLGWKNTIGVFLGKAIGRKAIIKLDDRDIKSIESGVRSTSDKMYFIDYRGLNIAVMRNADDVYYLQRDIQKSEELLWTTQGELKRLGISLQKALMRHRKTLDCAKKPLTLFVFNSSAWESFNRRVTYFNEGDSKSVSITNASVIADFLVGDNKRIYDFLNSKNTITAIFMNQSVFAIDKGFLIENCRMDSDRLDILISEDGEDTSILKYTSFTPYERTMILDAIKKRLTKQEYAGMRLLELAS